MYIEECGYIPRLGQRLCGEREHGNTEYRFAVADAALRLVYNMTLG